MDPRFLALPGALMVVISVLAGTASALVTVHIDVCAELPSSETQLPSITLQDWATPVGTLGAYHGGAAASTGNGSLVVQPAKATWTGGPAGDLVLHQPPVAYETDQVPREVCGQT